MAERKERGTSKSGRHGAPTELELHESNISLLRSEHNLLVKENEALKSQLSKYKMAHHHHAMDHGHHDPASSRLDWQNIDYEFLSTKLEQVMTELDALRTRQEKTMRECEHHEKEAEYYKKRCKLALQENQELQSTNSGVRSDLTLMMAEKEQVELERDNVQHMSEAEQQELDELRRQVYHSSGNAIYDSDHRLDNFMQRERDTIQQRYDTLVTKYSQNLQVQASTLKRCETFEKEAVRYRRSFEVAEEEKALMLKERLGLKHQLSNNIKEWENSLQEKNAAIEKYKMVQEQLKQTQAELSKFMYAQHAASKNMSRLQEECSNAVHDHKLIMSERDIVLRDMSKLEDERDAAVSKLAVTEADLKAAQNELETLRREISSALNDRDKALKECHDMKEKLDLLEKDPLRTADREKANGLIEAANRQVERFREEMLEAQREAEIASGRREFAFMERDKSMMERESIKMLCETFRQERDKAISDLAEMARQCDEVKRRRMQLAREANELRERLDNRRIPPLNSIAHNHSHDSAIDTDYRPYGSDSSEGEILPSSPVNVRPALMDAEVQTDISDLSRNNSTLRQKKFADSKLDKASWRKSLFEPKAKSRPPLDGLFDIDVKDSLHTTTKTKLPPSGRDKGFLDRAVGKLMLLGRKKDVFTEEGNLLTGDEGVAIAKLESVVQRYDSPNGTRFYTKTKMPKMPDKLPSGTWPKIKGPPLDSSDNILQEGTVRKEGKGGKVRKSIQSLTINGRHLVVKDIPLDDEPLVNMSPSLVNRKVPHRPQHRFSMQPTSIYDDTGCFTPRTPPSRRQILSVFPEKADDSTSLSSFVADFTDAARGRPSSVYPSSNISEYSGTLRRPPSAPLRSYLPPSNEVPPRLMSPATSVAYSSIQPRSSTFANSNVSFAGPRPLDEGAPRRPTTLTAAPPHQPRSYTMHDTDLYSYPRSLTSSKARHPSSEKSSFSGSYEHSPLGLVSSPLPSRAPFPLYDTVRKRPLMGKVRVVELRCKNGEHPGFKITECNGGIYVDKVEAGSLADKEGIVVGDQLQEACGLSLLNATKEQARDVLKAAAQSDLFVLRLCYCGPLVRGSDASITSSSATSIDSLRGPTGTLRGNPHRPSVTSFRSGSPDSVKSGQVHEARWVKLTKGLTDPLGINLIGGNVHGIFIHYVQGNSAAATASASSGNGALSCGDQILEYNAVDMRHLLLEKAMFELCKPVKSVAMLVQYNADKYEQAKQSAGDALFVRTLWDRDKAQLHDEDLMFHKGDILFIDNTLYNGEIGQWKGWLLEDGHKLADQVGIVPNVYRAVEEVLTLSHSHGGELHDSLDSHRRSARLSFGKLKKKKAQRREIASFTNASLGHDVFSVAPEEPLVATYERVNKVVYEEPRPVVILGPFGEEITDKLLRLYPDRYARCMPTAFSHSDEVIEKRQYSQVVNGWQSLTVGAVKNVADRGFHPLLDVSISSVEKMASTFNLCPIVLVVKFRNAADIRDVRDSTVVLTRISSKEAKELYELALRVEMEHSQVITSIIPGGTSLSHMVTTADREIEAAQTKPKWISQGPVA